MKKYNIPVMKISQFRTENVLTGSTQHMQTAMEQAQSAVANIEDSQKNFTILW